MQKTLIIAGIIILLPGIFWPFISKFPLFKLPGDIVIDKPGFKVYIPVTSMIIISLLITLIMWIVRKFL